MTVSVAWMRALARELQLRGVAPWPFLRDLGVYPRDLSDGSESVSHRTFECAVHGAVERTKDPLLGLAAGQHVPLEGLLGIGPLLLSCETLREALASLRRYAHLFASGATWELRPRQTKMECSFKLDGLSELAQVYTEDFTAAVVYRLLGQLWSADDCRSVEAAFRHAAPRDHARYQSVFGMQVRFGQVSGALLIANHLLDRPNQHSDPLARAVYAAFLDQIQGQSLGSSCTERVRKAMRRGLVATPLRVRSIADALNVTSRTLRRQLKMEGTSVSTLIEQEFLRNACLELSREAASIKEASSQLGFSEPSSFHRAFKRMSGITPQEFIRAQQPRQEQPSPADRGIMP